MTQDVEEIEVPVLVIGGGPVGMTLAMDLAWRGVSVAVAELRAPAQPPSAKCNHTSARSMEIFRRLGCAKAVREAGLPGDFDADVAYATRLIGHEICRIPLPASGRRYGAQGFADSNWPTPEPAHRISQLYLEPVLYRHADGFPGLTFFNEVEITSVGQESDHAWAVGRRLGSGTPIRFRAKYMVGCDGARSLVRKTLGFNFVGDAELVRSRSVLIRAPQLLKRLNHKPAWMTWVVGPGQGGTVVAIDGRELWLVHCTLPLGMKDFADLDMGKAVREVLGVEANFPLEVLNQEDWVARRLVSDRFHDRRIFIAGDAAHIWIPMAGYGMNAGIADAANLSWMLAGVLNGWADPALLEAHEAERHPITEQVSRHAMKVGEDYIRFSLRRKVPAVLGWKGPIGAMVRRAVGRRLVAMNIGQFAPKGLNFGYFYDQSPVVAYDGAKHPDYTMADYTPSTVPGARAPHIWLGDGQSLYDKLGPEFTLVRSDRSISVAPLVEAAQRRGVPLSVLEITREQAGGLYDYPLVLVRPDQHVAWRGKSLPSDPLALIDLVRGAGTPKAKQIAA